MIKELKLSNFRLFDDEVTVRFRPITVLIGRNNAGKSSVINFLLMLQQSLDASAAEFLNPEGERVKLGSFESLKNSVSEKKFLQFELEIQTSRFARIAEQVLESIEAEGKDKRVDNDGSEGRLKPTQQAEIYQESQARFTIMAKVPYDKIRLGRQKIKAISSKGFHIEREEKIRKTSLSFMNGINRIDKILSTKGGLPNEGVPSKRELSK